jgi:hypothetical protein
LSKAGSGQRLGRGFARRLSKREVKMERTSAGRKKGGVDGVSLRRVSSEAEAEADVVLSGDELPESLGGRACRKAGERMS